MSEEDTLYKLVADLRVANARAIESQILKRQLREKLADVEKDALEKHHILHDAQLALIDFVIPKPKENE